jgi:protein farnesyltransferase/geranylgeranyltransferase type-1 subunit alpha
MGDREASPGTESSSSSSSGEDGFLPFNERKGWEDMEPLPQDDGPQAVVRIAYSDKFRNVFDYFRAVLAKEERSERALELTEECVSLNPANYTVWYYRRVLLKELGKDLWQELAYSERVISDNPKNYQVWHHRKVIVELLGDPSHEKTFTEQILALDVKNYHAWQHRQWVVSEFSLWDNELEFSERLLDQDLRNNSAWNHRYFVVDKSTGFGVAEVMDRELGFAMVKIKAAPNNESAWNYLRGVLQERGQGLGSSTAVTAFCDELYAPPESCRSPHLLAFLVDAIEERLSTAPDPVLLEKAISMAQSLADEHDKIRTTFWNHVVCSLRDNYSSN